MIGKPRRWMIVAIAALTLLVAACSSASDEVSEQLAEKLIEASGDEDIDIDISEDGDDVTVNIETDDGESLSFGTGSKMPEGLEIPVPDGGDVTASGSQEDTVFVMLSYDHDRYDEIVGFYKDWTDGTGDDWSSQSTTMDMGEDTQRSSTWSDPDYTSMIIVTDCFSSEASEGKFNAACVSISQG